MQSNLDSLLNITIISLDMIVWTKLIIWPEQLPEHFTWPSLVSLQSQAWQYSSGIELIIGTNNCSSNNCVSRCSNGFMWLSIQVSLRLRQTWLKYIIFIQAEQYHISQSTSKCSESQSFQLKHNLSVSLDTGCSKTHLLKFLFQKRSHLIICYINIDLHWGAKRIGHWLYNKALKSMLDSFCPPL